MQSGSIRQSFIDAVVVDIILKQWFSQLSPFMLDSRVDGTHNSYESPVCKITVINIPDLPELKILVNLIKHSRWSLKVKNSFSSEHLLLKEPSIDFETFW